MMPKQRMKNIWSSNLERKSSLVEKIECSKKALFYGDCCDRNQVIVLAVLVLVSL